MSDDRDLQPNTITYWEERSVNIGHYESRKFGISVTTKVVDLNNVDRKVVLSLGESAKIYPNQSVEETIDSLTKIVRDRLDRDELVVRKTVEEFLEEDLIRKGRKIFNIESDENMITEVDDKPRRAKKKQAPKYDDEDDFEMINEDEVTTKKSKRRSLSHDTDGMEDGDKY